MSATFLTDFLNRLTIFFKTLILLAKSGLDSFFIKKIFK